MRIWRFLFNIVKTLLSMNKEFLFRFIRLLTIVIGVLYVVGLPIRLKVPSFSHEYFWFIVYEQIWFFVYWTLLLALPVVVNWLVFEKLQFWISKTNLENEYKFLERLSGVVSVFTVILWVAINGHNLYRPEYFYRTRYLDIFVLSFLVFIIPVVYNYLFLGKIKFWIYDRSFFESLKTLTLKKLISGK